MLYSISERLTTSVRTDKQWVMQSKTGILEDRLQLENHKNMLISYEEGCIQKHQEIMYLIHYLEEIDWWKDLSLDTQNEIIRTGDCVIGCQKIIQYLEALVDGDQFS